MNIITFLSDNHNQSIVYCIVDNTHQISNTSTKEFVKNISDFTISNIWSKGFNVLVGLDEDELLRQAVAMQYEHAVVVSTGIEFINGSEFFNAVNLAVKQDYLLIGHILDHGDAYYELHKQCYILNLKKYQTLGCPAIGQQQLAQPHEQFVPDRSTKNYHDNYTPLWVRTSKQQQRKYLHKCHGWNILTYAWNNDYTTLVFDDTFRSNKKYYYPETTDLFLDNYTWAYARERYCSIEHVHTNNTEIVMIPDKDFTCVITPASGTWFLPYISTQNSVKVVYYDYNQKSIDYWKEHAPQLDNISYEFVRIDLLSTDSFDSLLGYPEDVLLNLSDIFCYEGTSALLGLRYRLHKENQLLSQIPNNYRVLFSSRSSLGFIQLPHYGKCLSTVDIKQLKKPTWHMNSDWQ